MEIEEEKVEIQRQFKTIQRVLEHSTHTQGTDLLLSAIVFAGK